MESNLKQFKFIKKMSGLHAGTSWTDNKRTGDSPKQLNYAAGRLVAVIVYCFSTEI